MDTRLILVLFGLFFWEQTAAYGRKCTNKMIGTSFVPCGFRQGSKWCIPDSWECDGQKDCSDGSDESFCQFSAYGDIAYTTNYDYVGDMFFPDRSDGLQVESRVIIKQKREGNKRITRMKLENPKLTQKAASTPEAGQNLLSDDEKKVWQTPIVFDILDSGDITNIRTEKDEPDDVLNIKRSIASFFQMKFKSAESKYENVETDPTGTCRMKYTAKKETFNMRYKSVSKNTKKALYKYNITKINDYSDCEERPTYRFTRVQDPAMCTKEDKVPLVRSRAMTSCTVYEHESMPGTAPFIHSCHSRERHDLKSLTKNKASTEAQIHAERKLTFVELHMSYSSSMWAPKRERSMLFSFDDLKKPRTMSDRQTNIDEIKGFLDKLTKMSKKDTMAYDLMDVEVPKIYLKLIMHLRWKTSQSTFTEIYSKFFKDDYRFWLESALPFIGTEASGAEIRQRINSGEIKERDAIKLFTRLGLVSRPDEGLLDHILKLCKSPKHNETVTRTCWLAFGSLIRTYCREKNTCPSEYIQALKDNYDENLHSQDHHMKVIKDNENLVVALKTIGNAGQIAHLPLPLHILTQWNDHNAIMIAAIESLRRMPLEGDDLSKAQMALLNIFTNKTMSPEIRIVAFSALLNTGPATNIIIRLTSTIRSEGNPLVKKYVYTHLRSERKNNCAEKKSCKASRDLLKRLSNVPHEDFDPRFSSSASHTVGETDHDDFQLYRHMVSMETVHTPVSVIPRFLNFKNTMKMAGLEFDHMEFKLRQREVVKLMRDLFGPYGSMYDKKALWDFIRSKREVKDAFPEVYRRMQETINPKTKYDIPFKATLSTKLFGAEIIYLVLNESNPIIQDLIKDGTIRIDRDWWANSFKAGMQWNMTNSDLLLNSKLIIPTSTGIPLNLRANVVGSFAFNMYADVTSSPMLNLLSWDNKPTDISGTYKQCFSISTYTYRKFYWSYRDTKIGYATHQNYAMRCPAPVDKFVYSIQPPEKKMTVKMPIHQSKYVYVNSSLSIARFAKVKGVKVYEKSVKVKNIPTKSISSSFFDFYMAGADQVQSMSPSYTDAKSGEGKPKAEEGTSRKCNYLLKNYTEICYSTDNDDNSYREMAWYAPGKKHQVDNFELLFQNVTKDGDKQLRFDMQLNLNGADQKALTELHVEMSNSKETDPVTYPLQGNTDYRSFMMKSFQKTDGKIERYGCLWGSINTTARQLDVGMGWGNNCSHHVINSSTIYNGEVKNNRFDVITTWKNLPEHLERMTCSRKYIEKQMEMWNKIGNAGMGAQGGMFGPPKGMGQNGGQPPKDDLPCLTSLNVSFSIRNGKQLILTGFPKPTSEIANVTLPLPYNATQALAKAWDFMKYGATDTCKVYQNREDIITFDQRSYKYSPCTGCPHVLAKDCSKKELFAVFMNRNSTDEKEITLVIKDKKNVGHEFLIKPDLTVVYDGSVLRLEDGPSTRKSAHIKRLCYVTKSNDEVVIRCLAGVIVVATTEKIEVKVSPWYFRYMCGMCGNNNWMASDDIRKWSNGHHLGASWLVPGKSCNSDCTIVHRPEVKIKDETDELCVTTSPVTRCAPNCKPTKTTTVNLGYHCISRSTDLAMRTQQQISNKEFQKVIDAFRNKSKDIKELTPVHFDCKCVCPIS